MSSHKIIWEAPESPNHDFREEGTEKILARLSYRAGVTQGFINLATGLNMSKGGVAGTKCTARLKTRIRMASAYTKMTDRTLTQALECLDLIQYTDETYPGYGVVVLMGVVPTKKQKSPFFTGRHRQIICLQSEEQSIREEMFAHAKSEYHYNFDTGDDPEMDVSESNIT